MSLTPDTAYNAFTSSVACIGSTVCQMGMGDSQSLLTSCFEEMATQYAASDALPQIYISGCPSSCGTHQIGELGFRGTVKVIKGTAHPAFTMYINGCSLQGSEHLGEEAGTLLAEDIPSCFWKSASISPKAVWTLPPGRQQILKPSPLSLLPI